MRTRYLYIARCEGYAKIGTTVDPKARASGCRSGNLCPSEMSRIAPVVLCGAALGGFHEERILHHRLKVHRAAGEWYYDTAEFRKDIEGVFDIPATQFVPAKVNPFSTPEFHYAWFRLMNAVQANHMKKKLFGRRH